MNGSQDIAADLMALLLTWLPDGVWGIECERRRADLSRKLVAFAAERGLTVSEAICEISQEFAFGRQLPGEQRRGRRRRKKAAVP